MKLEDMLDLIDIDSEEVEKAKYYMHLKGIDLHHSIMQYLLCFSGKRVKYCEIATVYRYDKRIRKILYKYIGLFEEYIRAYISNKFSDQPGQLPLTPAIRKLLVTNAVLFQVLNDVSFGDLIHLVFLLGNEDKAKLFPKIEFDEGNLRAIIELRNAVSHNRFLLNYLKFKSCTINNEKKGSFYANLVNFSNYLPTNISSGFLEEINACCEHDPNIPNKTEFQTIWSLPKEVVINL